MDEAITQLTDYLIKHYFISKADASLMIDDEFIFIEQYLDTQNVQIKDIAKALIDIYMVA